MSAVSQQRRRLSHQSGVIAFTAPYARLAPRKAAFGEAEFKPLTPTNGQLIALCVECTTVMHKRVSLATLEVLKGILHITIRQEAKPIVRGEQVCLNDA